MIKTDDIVLIDGVKKDTLWNRIKSYFPKNVVVSPPTKTLEMYNQGKNPFCTAFACATVLSYNTGRKFTNEELDTWSQTFIKKGGSIPGTTVNRFCESFGAHSVPPFRWEKAQEYLSMGFAVMVDIMATREMFRDGINDGSIDADYAVDKKMSHEITVVYRDKHFRLINTWANYQDKGYHNEYKIRGALLDKIIRSGICYLLY